MPEPMYTPTRSAFPASILRPESDSASDDAATA